MRNRDAPVQTADAVMRIRSRAVIAVFAAAVSGLILGAAAVYLAVYRESSRADRELRRYRAGSRNARVRTPLRPLSKLFMQLNGVLEDAQALEIENGRARRRIQDLLSGVSHDIRTPLTSIMGYLQALRDGVPANAREESEFLDIVLQKTEGIRNYSESVFRLARLEADGAGIRFVPLDLAEILRQSVLTFVPFLEREKFLVEISIPEEKCPMNGEEVSLMRIFQNLIGNATRHGSDGKYLGIRMTSVNDFWKITVEDRGRGLSPELIRRILAPDTADAGEPDFRGTEGLGLTITRRLVEAHDGRFDLESTPREKTVVTLLFPSLDTRASEKKRPESVPVRKM